MLRSLLACWQRFISAPWDSTEQCQAVLEDLAWVLGATHASLVLVDEDQRALLRVGALGRRMHHAITRIYMGDAMAQWMQQHSQLLQWVSGTDIPAFVREFDTFERMSTALCVPLAVNGRITGALSLARTGASAPFAEQDIWAAMLIADRLALALAHAHSQQQLEYHSQLTSRIVESIPSSLVIFDRRLRIISANRTFLEKAGRQAHTTVGCHIAEVFPRLLLEYTRLDQKVREIFRTGQAVDGGKLSYRAPRLAARVYYYRLVPLKVGPAVKQVVLLLDDITQHEQLGAEVRRMERRLASVVESASDLVLSLDRQGRIVTWNQAAERVCGLAAEQVRGKLLLSLCAAGDRSTMAGMLRQCVAPTLSDRVTRHVQRSRAPAAVAPAARGDIQNIEVSLTTADAQEVSIVWNCSPMRDDAGKVVGIALLGRDLTEHRRMEAKLAQASKMASLGVMAGGIAHELRNPLGIIASNAQLLDEHSDDRDLRGQCIQRIYRATQRASLIIENLLKFARPYSTRKQAVQLDALLADVLPMLAPQLEAQRIRLVHARTPNLAPAHANPELLQLVFTNLILNACNAMPDGGTLTISSRRASPEQAEIRFSDTGHGIAPEQITKIFEPFFTTMPIGKGTGLGLSISYSIIQHHGGTIEVTSQVDHGTTFTLRLPIDLLDNEGEVD